MHQPKWPPLNVITPWHPESLAAPLSKGTSALALGNTASTAVGTINQAWFYPFRLYETATVVKLSLVIGATAAGNIDIGVYDAQGNLLVSSGSTAQGSTSTLQSIDVTDTTLQPGTYWMAVMGSDATGTWFARLAADELLVPYAYALQQTTGGFGLPNPATMSRSSATTMPLIAMGVHFDTLI